MDGTEKAVVIGAVAVGGYFLYEDVGGQMVWYEGEKLNGVWIKNGDYVYGNVNTITVWVSTTVDHKFAVRAWNRIGYSDFSNEVLIPANTLVPSITIPSPPLNFKLSPPP